MAYENADRATDEWIPQRRSSWGAIFGGVFVGLGILIILAILGIAVGFSTINPYDEQNPRGLAIGQAVWWIISGIIALFAAGWVAGVLSGFINRTVRIVNGLVVWGLITVIMLYLAATTAGAVLSGGLRLLQAGAGAVAAAAPALGQATKGIDKQTGISDSARQQIDEIMGRMSEQDRRRATEIVTNAIQQGKLSEEDRRDLDTIVGRATNTSPEKADSTVQQWSQKFKESREKTTEAAKKAADAASNTAAGISWAMFVVLLLNAIAAALGGALGGAPRDR